MKKFNILPTINRANKRANFPYGFRRYYPQIYSSGLPESHIELTYKLGAKEYSRLYTAIRFGYIRGILFRDKKRKWHYAVEKKDVYKDRNYKRSVKGRAKKSLIKIKDLKGEEYITLRKAASIIGFHYDTLKSNFDNEQLRAEILAPGEYKTLGFDARTKIVVQVKELRLWLEKILSGEIISRAKIQSRKYCNILRHHRRETRYRDKQVAATGTYRSYMKKKK